jgi:predicted ATPase
MHRIGVVHRNVNPSNIVIARAGSRPILIDFCAATSSVADGVDIDPAVDFEGSLAYMAPEQTGRTGRTVDQRADLYSLGVVMYELATGRKPFAGDDFGLIRDQLLRTPVAPDAVDPNVSPALSGLIMRLLQKEPEQRYQSAEGLAADLVSLIERRNAGVTAAFPLAERDFPQRLVPPARIVGRDTELAELDRAFSDALAGRANVLLIEGAAGVGKTALVNELRSLVTVNDGCFVSGTFDRLQHDSEADAVAIAFRGLFRLLLTEPENVLVEFRSRLLATIGDAAPYAGALYPEAAMLLGVDPHVAEPDPLEALVNSSPNAINGGVDLVKCLASAARPIVFVVEDWQWASATALRFLDAVVTAPSAPGFLFIGTYRAANGDGTDAVLQAAFLRWKLLGVMPARFSLGNLGLPDLESLLQGMLRLAAEPAGRLARIVYSRTAGNPYDSIELINALRVDGALTIGAAGWTWNEETIRHYVGHGNVVDLLATRIAALPPETRTLLEIGACLGGNSIALALLQSAADLANAEALERALQPALDDGLVVLLTEANASVRFRHERVQQAAYDRLSVLERSKLHLVLARRLLRVPEYEGSAAEQYLPAAGELHDPAEMLRACELFRRAAARERAGFNDSLVERFTSAALVLVRSTPNAEPGLQTLLEAELHAALYRLARFSEADAVYAQLAERCPDPLRIVDSACVQISSLTNRMLGDRAMTLGLDLLTAVGFGIPAAAELARVVEEQLDAVSSWCDDDTAEARDALRPETADARVGAAAKLLSRLAPSGLFAGDERVRWLVLKSFELWTAHGPCAALVHPLSCVGFIMIDVRADYHRAYRITRRVLRASEARRYDAGTALARFNFSVGLAHWFEPFQACIAEAQRAHDELIRVGDMQFASFTYFASIQLLLESAASLDDVLREADAGIAFCVRSGNDQARSSYLAYRQLARSLMATTDLELLFTDQTFGQEAHVAGLVGNPVATLSYHIARAMSAALFGRSADLIVHADAAFPLISTVQPPSTALVHLLHAFALARRIHGASTQSRPALLRALDRSRHWLQHRAEDAPDSYAHAARLIAAERAWALDDSEGASSAFEAALLNIPATLAPWNRALTEERAALFYLGHGLMRYGRSLLLEAHGHYADWGAGAKVRQLELAYPFLRDATRERAHSGAEAGVADAVDMVAILRASQALSSETSRRD